MQAGTWPYAATAQELEYGDRARVSCQHGPKPLRIDEKVGLICWIGPRMRNSEETISMCMFRASIRVDRRPIEGGAT
ncbi:MAG: hypothetical protein WBQ29_20380, partial [Isosphaeraceae bacterium]